MRLSGLAGFIVLLFTSFVFAQHSSSGGSSSASSSSSGSHSSSFSSSSISSGGHISSGSSGHGTSSSSPRSTSSVAFSRGGSLSSSEARPLAPPEKKTFISRVFHPFRKTQQPIQADLRRPICPKGHCVCPGGLSARNGVCSSPRPYRCETGAYWNGGGCVGSTGFRLNDCRSLAILMGQQSRRMSMAESLRQNSCSISAPECNELTARSTDEAVRYHALQQQYEQCRHQFADGYGFSFAAHSASGLRDPFSIN